MRFLTAIAIAAIMISPARALAADEKPIEQPKHLVVFSQILQDAYGRDIPEACATYDVKAPGQPCKEWTAFTLGWACVNVLAQTIEADKAEDVRKKYRRDELARKIGRSEATHVPVALTSEEKQLIRERVPLVYPSAIVTGAVTRLVDPDSAAAEGSK